MKTTKKITADFYYYDGLNALDFLEENPELKEFFVVKRDLLFDIKEYEEDGYPDAWPVENIWIMVFAGSYIYLTKEEYENF